MSKLICDVCGTSYPETATQCPICGCVRPSDVAPAVNHDRMDKQQLTYTYVKGGRFSKSNVKKRNRGQEVPTKKVTAKNNDGEKSGSNKGLVIAVIVLLLAIAVVVAYICISMFGAGGKPEQPQQPVIETTTQATETTVLEIPCVEIILSKTEIRFEKAGAALLLNISTNPGNTTEPFIFTSSDEKVATISEDGKVTAVGGGTAVVSVQCGEAVSQCTVICDFEGSAEESTQASTEATTEPPTPANDEFALNREDMTLIQKGETHKLYTGSIPADQILWSTSDEKVAQVDKGVVKAVGAGTATITAEYAGQKLTCIVRCRDTVGVYVETETPDTEQQAAYTISHEDVTLRIGESFNLTLKDKDGNAVSVTWTCSDSAIATIDGSKVTAVAAGVTKVSVTHEGQTYTCIIRVKGA